MTVCVCVFLCAQFAVVAQTGLDPDALTGAAFQAAAERAPADPKVALLRGTRQRDTERERAVPWDSRRPGTLTAMYVSDPVVVVRSLSVYLSIYLCVSLPLLFLSICV
jgi:hypothetical protein